MGRDESQDTRPGATGHAGHATFPGGNPRRTTRRQRHGSHDQPVPTDLRAGQILGEKQQRDARNKWLRNFDINDFKILIIPFFLYL